MIRLHYMGRDVIRRDAGRLLDMLRQRYPNVSEAALHQIAKAELARMPPRHKGEVLALFGADILTEDPTTIPAWGLLTAEHRSRVLNPDRYPELRGGGRAALVDPQGLQHTYVWRYSNAWTQEVAPEDARVIREAEITEDARRRGKTPPRYWFRDLDRHGPYTPMRAFDLPVVGRETFSDALEARRYEDSLKRVKQWTGV